MRLGAVLLTVSTKRGTYLNAGRLFRAQLKEQMDTMLAMQQKMEQRQPQGQPPQRTDEDADDRCAAL